MAEPKVLKMPITTTSTPSNPKHEWLVILPDHEGVLAKRMSVRPSHLKDLGPKVEEGFWIMGGATLSEPIQDPSSPNITGSIMLALAESKEEVMEQLKKDIYSTSGVWDWDKVQVHPSWKIRRGTSQEEDKRKEGERVAGTLTGMQFKSAFRKNMEGL